MSDAHKKPHTSISLRERFLLNKLLEPNILVHADGTCEYLPGWSDARVVKEGREGGIPNLNMRHVGNQRGGVFGKLSNPANGRTPRVGSLDEIYARLALLEDEIKLLKETIL
jgi:hypothetical protein